MNIISHSEALQYLSQGLRQDRLSPSLLFSGPEGVGKRTVAFALAQCFSCDAPQNSPDKLPRCGTCASCQRVQANNHSDVLFIDRTLQATLAREKVETQTFIKIESVRYLDKFLRLRPSEGRRRTTIVEEAHNLTNDAANALLKILEEPPANTQIILLVTDEKMLPATVLSRCAILRFRPLPAGRVASWLEARSISAERASEVADLAGGSLSRAIAIAEEEEVPPDLGSFQLDEFFEMLAEPSWRRDAREKASRAVAHWIEASQRKLEAGDLAQTDRLRHLLAAQRQLERNVSPRLVLGNLYLQLADLSGNRS